MLFDASVARSVAVLGWVDQAAQAVGGSMRLAHGVLGAHPDELCELRQIRDGLQRAADDSPAGSGRYSKAVSAVFGLDKLLGLGPPQVTVVMPDAQATAVTARLTSMTDDARAWRRGLGMRARRLDAGEAVSIGIAVTRGLDFASDDGQALVAYTALTGRAELRTREILKILVDQELLNEAMVRDGYRFLQDDDLHLLGGPGW